MVNDAVRKGGVDGRKKERKAKRPGVRYRRRVNWDRGKCTNLIARGEKPRADNRGERNHKFRSDALACPRQRATAEEFNVTV